MQQFQIGDIVQVNDPYSPHNKRYGGVYEIGRSIHNNYALIWVYFGGPDPNTDSFHPTYLKLIKAKEAKHEYKKFTLSIPIKVALDFSELEASIAKLKAKFGE